MCQLCNLIVLSLEVVLPVLESRGDAGCSGGDLFESDASCSDGDLFESDASGSGVDLFEGDEDGNFEKATPSGDRVEGSPPFPKVRHSFRKDGSRGGPPLRLL